jgi:hypothetical protein
MGVREAMAAILICAALCLFLLGAVFGSIPFATLSVILAVIAVFLKSRGKRLGRPAFDINDRVKVVAKQYNAERKIYPFYPDLADKVGRIVEVIDETLVAHQPLDGYIYVVEFAESFQRAILNEHNHIVGHEDCSRWQFLEDALERV